MGSAGRTASVAASKVLLFCSQALGLPVTFQGCILVRRIQSSTQNQSLLFVRDMFLFEEGVAAIDSTCESSFHGDQVRPVLEIVVQPQLPFPSLALAFHPSVSSTPLIRSATAAAAGGR